MTLICLILYLSILPAYLNQTPANRVDVPPELLARLSTVMRSYVRDSAEIPLNVRSTVTVLRSNGKRIRKTDSHVFQASGATIDSDGIVRERVTVKNVRQKLLSELSETDHAVLLSAFPIAFGADKPGFSFNYVNGTETGTLTVFYRSTAPCKAFHFENGKWRLAEWCGSGEITVAADSLLPIRGQFRADGLPVYSGKDELRSYTVQHSYQSVPLLSGTTPYLLPKKVSATYQAATATTTVEAEFETPPVR